MSQVEPCWPDCHWLNSNWWRLPELSQPARASSLWMSRPRVLRSRKRAVSWISFGTLWVELEIQCADRVPPFENAAVGTKPFARGERPVLDVRNRHAVVTQADLDGHTTCIGRTERATDRRHRTSSIDVVVVVDRREQRAEARVFIDGQSEIVRRCQRTFRPKTRRDRRAGVRREYSAADALL